MDNIGEAARHELCRDTLDAVLRFYSDPENRKRFEEWKAKRAKKSA